MMESLSIKHPELLQVNYDGRYSFGYNQEWYGDDWKKLSGCGPTTATQVISYVEFRDGILNKNDANDGKKALERMNSVWPFVTPRFGGGLYKTAWFEKGLQQFANQQDLPYEVKRLDICPFVMMRPSLEDVTDFISTGLRNDSPVGFLNRHRGKERELYTWHWVTIIALDKLANDVRCLVYDDEIERHFSLKAWLKDTLLGGGFAYIASK